MLNEFKEFIVKKDGTIVMKALVAKDIKLDADLIATAKWEM